MKKTLLLFLLALLFVSCSSDDDNDLDDSKGSTALTTDQITGTYTLSQVRNPNTDDILLDCPYSSYSIKLEANGKGSDIDGCENKSVDLTWNYSNKKLLLSHSSKGNIDTSIKNYNDTIRYNTEDNVTMYEIFNTSELSFSLSNNGDKHTYTYKRSVRLN